PGIDEAGDRHHPAGRARRFRRRPARGGDRRPAIVLLARAPAWRPRPGAAVPAPPDRARAEPQDQSREGLRPDASARESGGWLPGHGRAPRDQDALAPRSIGGTRMKNPLAETAPKLLEL